MTHCEKYALDGILRSLQPQVSIEIGTYKGGSLQVLSHSSQKVFSVDVDPTVEQRLGNMFQNVEYRCGLSHTLLPEIFQDVQAQDLDVEFILVDGDHSEKGVHRDLEALLQVVPRKPCVVLMHDSFNPDCREGIKAADWSSSPYVQWVELDFIPGVYHHTSYDTASARTMWGGFACAVLAPDVRQGLLKIEASQQPLFEAVFSISAHACAKKSFWEKVNLLMGRLRT